MPSRRRPQLPSDSNVSATTSHDEQLTGVSDEGDAEGEFDACLDDESSEYTAPAVVDAPEDDDAAAVSDEPTVAPISGLSPRMLLPAVSSLSSLASSHTSAAEISTLTTRQVLKQMPVRRELLDKFALFNLGVAPRNRASKRYAAQSRDDPHALRPGEDGERLTLRALDVRCHMRDL